MAFVNPLVFVCYSTRDKDFVSSVISHLQFAQIDVWQDQSRIIVGDSIRDKIAREGIDKSDLFFFYITANSVNSESCIWEWKYALEMAEQNKLLLAYYIDSQETLENAPQELAKELSNRRYEVLNSENFRIPTAGLIGRAWEAVQHTRRLVNHHGHILAGINIVESKFRRSEFMKRVRRHLLVAGPNLRGWLTTREARSSIIDLIRNNSDIEVTMILGTYPILEALSGGYGQGRQALEGSVQELRAMVKELSAEENQRFNVRFHFAAATMSAVIRDPEENDGVLVFTPRWGIDYEPLGRLFCVIEKKNNPGQFDAIYRTTFNLIQPDALTLDEM